MKTLWLIIIISVTYSHCSEIPSFVHVCRRHDPKLEQCLISAIEGIRPVLATGVPEDGIPSIEPLLMPNLTTHTAGINIESEEVKTFGCSDFFVRKIRANIENQHYEINLEMPKLRILSNYTILGRFLILPINDSGVMEIFLKDVITKVTMKGFFDHHRGEKFIKFDESEVSIKYGKGYADLGHLFGRTSLPNYVLNYTVNKHFDAFAEELLPLIEESMAIAVLNVANKVVQGYTFRQLFPH